MGLGSRPPTEVGSMVGRRVASSLLMAALLAAVATGGVARADVPDPAAPQACAAQPSGSLYPAACFSKNLTYGRTNFLLTHLPDYDHARIRVNLHYDWYAPADATGHVIGQRRPLVILVHGGGFINELSHHQKGDMEKLAYYYARNGYVAIDVDYLTLPEAWVADPADAGEARLGDAQVRLRDPSGWVMLSREAQRDVQTLVRYVKEYASS